MNKGEVGSRRRTPLLAGNWKMYKTSDETSSFVRELASIVGPADGRDIVVAPPFTSLVEAKRSAAGTPIAVAAQNVFWEPEGAYTGEVSGPMLKACKAEQVIIAHSERRLYFNETEKTAAKRVQAALKAGLTPLLCVGETLGEREADQTDGVLESQLAGGLAGLKPAQAEKLIIAYEPVWAIGTGQTATEEQANRAHAFIRAWLGACFGKQVANQCRILYGGSVKPENAAGLMRQKEIDGALVGGASLQAESFLGIIEAA